MKDKKRNILKIKDLGIKIITKFYIFLIFLYLLPFFFFTTRLVILGKPLETSLTIIINLAFIALLLYLYFAIKNFVKRGLWTAIVFHTFFILNSLLMVFDRTPLLKIEGLKEGTHIFQIPIILTSIFINIAIISYLLYRRTYF